MHTHREKIPAGKECEAQDTVAVRETCGGGLGHGRSAFSLHTQTRRGWITKGVWPAPKGVSEAKNQPVEDAMPASKGKPKWKA